MKILHVIPAVARRYGGPSTAVLQMCRALSDAGQGVVLATTDADGGGSLRVPLSCPTRLDGVDAVVFPRQWSEAFKYSRPLAAWLRRHVLQFDVVHIHALLSHACLAAASACRRADVPYVIRPLGTLDPWSLAQKPWRKRVLLFAGGRTALAGADAVHYTAAAEQASVEAGFQTRRGFVAPLGLDDALFAPPVPYDARATNPFVLAISRLHPVKALDALIEAFARVHDGRWRLVIAGDGEAQYVRRLKALAAGTPAARAIEFRGWVDGDEKRVLLRTASLLALPSHHENFGVGLGEAMACGTPAIVSRHVLIAADVAGAGAGWISDNTVPALTDSLREVLDDAPARAAASGAARAFAERLTWPRVATTLIATYEQVVRQAAESRLSRISVTAGSTRRQGHAG